MTQGPTCDVSPVDQRAGYYRCPCPGGGGGGVGFVVPVAPLKSATNSALLPVRLNVGKALLPNSEADV